MASLQISTMASAISINCDFRHRKVLMCLGVTLRRGEASFAGAALF
jgi:hypothetical protein